MYARRSKMNPIWNTLLVGGVRNGERCVSFLRLRLFVSLLNPTLRFSLRFLGYVDLIGTTYTSSTLATGYGAYMFVESPSSVSPVQSPRPRELQLQPLTYADSSSFLTASFLSAPFPLGSAQPLLRKAVEGREDELTREEAEKILIECMKVLYYRDARALNKVSLVPVVSPVVASRPLSDRFRLSPRLSTLSTHRPPLIHRLCCCQQDLRWLITLSKRAG